jgi:hypothetical protein
MRSLRGSFFKGLLGLRITLWMLRSDRKPHIAQGLELLANCAFVQPDPEHLLDPPFEIDASPPNYAVFFRIGTFLDKSGKFGLLLCAQLARAARPPAVFKPRQTFRILAMHPIAQRLAIHPAGFGRSLAVFALKHQSDRQHPPGRLGIAGLR